MRWGERVAQCDSLSVDDFGVVHLVWVCSLSTF